MNTENTLDLPPEADAPAAGARSRLSFAIPVIVVAVIGVALAIGLTLNPRDIPSALIGSSVPEFDLPPIQGAALGLATADLKGGVSVVNVWASWCTECRKEHPLLMTVSERAGVPVQGINYKDRPADAENMIKTLGDPYTRSGADLDGRVSIDWGVYGVPETFVVDRQGRIVYKRIGRLTEQELTDNILPLIEKLKLDGS